ncbi:MAG: hypothetical protein QOE70_5964 [Chthoniobacter sp.]|jgi:hypothetical protein|nr:hypothetical protein [Chthoniobacter sp.]
MLSRMAGSPTNTVQEYVAYFPLQDERESLLAFSFNADGKPNVVADFRSDRDKLALLHLAQVVIAQFGRDIGDLETASLYRQDAA